VATRSMAAVVHYELRSGAVELREVPVPTDLADDEVLLETGAVGVCGSDIHQYHNTQSWAVYLPVILGHEFCGTIVQVGKRVREFREGDRVTSETAARICGRCILCRTGEYNLCPERRGFGYGLNGAMADYVKVPERCLHRLPDSVPLEMGALTEPCCVAYNATCVKAQVRPGDAVLVLGPGTIGLLCLTMARLSGAGWVGIAGLKQDERRLAVAKSLGADRTIILGEEDAAQVARSRGDGLGVDVVVDAAGHSSALAIALAAVRPNGQIAKVGWGPQPLDFSLDSLVQRAVRIQGSFSHNYPIWEKVIGLFASGRLDPRPLMGPIQPLSRWQVAFENMIGGEVIKSVLRPEKASGS
jgi:L-iditol 2-dehydrogenase